MEQKGYSHLLEVSSSPFAKLSNKEKSIFLWRWLITLFSPSEEYSLSSLLLLLKLHIFLYICACTLASLLMSMMLFLLPIFCASLFSDTEIRMWSGDGQTSGKSWQSWKSLICRFLLWEGSHTFLSSIPLMLTDLEIYLRFTTFPCT